MQDFIVTIRVTVNTLETVSSIEVQSAITDVLDSYDGGSVVVTSCDEV